jgi:putative glutamine amidotransferase
MKPRIGITPCVRMDDYVESIARAGGQPVVLKDSDDAAAAIGTVDGVLLTGGLDVDPSLYGEETHATTQIAAERDRFEIPLSNAAIELDLPLLAICRGVQVLNVAAGGSLIQDIPSALKTAVNHSIDVPKDHLAHHVKITPCTKLADALGATPDLHTCAVNSRHHQSVGRVAPAFVVSAISPDGVVEAIERPTSTFCVGVQWHPENFLKTGAFDGLFARFVAAAGARTRATEVQPAAEARTDPLTK